MSRTRTVRSIVALVTPIAFLLVTGCACKKDRVDLAAAAVPDATARLEYDLGAGDPEAVIDQAIDHTTCLLRAGENHARECRDGGRPPSCTTRSEEDVRAALEPAFEAVAGLELTSRSRINAEVREKVPGATSTTAVRDARRESACRDWNSDDGACVAIRIDRVWVLLHAPADGTGAPDRLEVFLAEPVCDPEPK